MKPIVFIKNFKLPILIFAALAIVACQKDVYIITTTVNPVGAGSITGAGEYIDGESATLEATPAGGYNFVNWTEDGNIVTGNAKYSFIVTGPRDLTANFASQIYTISAYPNPAEGGSISGTGDYSYQETAVLIAESATGYDFINWTENENEVSTEASYSFTVTESRELTANFKKSGPLPGIWSGDGISFTVSEDGSYVSDFSFYYSGYASGIYCSVNYSGTIGLGAHMTIESNKFTYDSSKYEVIGEFTDNENAEIKVSWSDYNYHCYADIKGSRTYHASHQGGSK